MKRMIEHVALRVTNLDSSIVFYRDVMGSSPSAAGSFMAARSTRSSSAWGMTSSSCSIPIRSYQTTST